MGTEETPANVTMEGASALVTDRGKRSRNHMATQREGEAVSEEVQREQAFLPIPTLTRKRYMSNETEGELFF